MRFIKIAAAIAFSTLAVTNAFAEFTFTNVSATNDSVTFTINGDMSGYANSSVTDQFSIAYSGTGFSQIFDYTGNSWSESVFDNFSLSYAGNTGVFGSQMPYSWSMYNDDLSSAVATNRTVTLTTANNFGSGTSGTLTFEWGNGNTESGGTTVLGSVELGAVSPVPEPESFGMMALGLAALGGLRRLRRAKQAA